MRTIGIIVLVALVGALVGCGGGEDAAAGGPSGGYGEACDPLAENQCEALAEAVEAVEPDRSRSYGYCQRSGEDEHAGFCTFRCRSSAGVPVGAAQALCADLGGECGDLAVGASVYHVCLPTEP